MKAVLVSIKSAGFFRNPHASKTKDKVYDSKGKKDRNLYINVPGGKMSYGHIANLLRVLCGERPVPQIRKVEFKGDPNFELWAKDVRVSISTPVNQRGFYPRDILNARKSIGDSWQTSKHSYLLDNNNVMVKGGVMHWDRLRVFLGVELFNEYRILVKKFSSEYISCQESIELLNRKKEHPEIDGFCTKLLSSKKTSLVNIIRNSNPDSITFHSSPSCPLNLVMACGGPEELQKYDAVLYIPANEEQLEMLSKGVGIATFLEGGFAKIEGVEDWSEELINSQTEASVEGEHVSN